MGRGRRVDKAKLAAAAIVAFNREGTVPEATAARVSAVSAVSKPAARPIETIQVGQRVLARNPEVTSAQRAAIQEPVWESWLQISLMMPVGELPSDPNQPPAILSIEILRPESWLQDEIGFELAESADFASVAYAPLRSSQADASLELEADVDDSAADSPLVPLSPLRPIFRDIALVSLLAEDAGYEVAALTVDMNLPEMGAVGLAVITNIQPCPAIEQATGEVVTATFAHPPTHQVLDVSFEGDATPIGVTSNHPFWSADRQCFLPIGEMAVGDRVITYAGATKRIESLLPRPGPETVFNLEVYGEHVYYVGGQGLLVHNQYPLGAPNSAVDAVGFSDKRVSLLGRWLGSKRLTHVELLAYEKELAGYGVSLKRGRTATELLKSKNARAAFDSFNDVVYLRKNATRYDAFHELQHVKQRSLLGQKEYRAIGEFARETYVFQQIWKNRRMFNYDELKHAINYLRDERYLFRIGAID